MRQAGFLAAFAAVALLAAADFVRPADRPAASLWAPSPIVIDGAAGEWAGDERTAVAETPVDLAFRNDGRNVYILFEFREPVALGTIARTGMAVYRLSPESGKRLGGIRLLVRTVSADRFVDLLERQGRRLSERDKVEIRMKPFYPVFEALAISGKGKVLAEPVLSTGDDPPGFKVAAKDGRSVYEIRLPIKSWAGGSGAAGSLAGGDLVLEFEWGGFVTADDSWIINGDQGGDLLVAIFPNISPGTLLRTDPRYKKHTVRFDVKLAASS
jgi:hypothetical protein